MAWEGAACCSAGALEPPENQPPMAWPMDEPTATPLQKKLACGPKDFRQ
jgi:hypothetical protein